MRIVADLSANKDNDHFFAQTNFLGQSNNETFPLQPDFRLLRRSSLRNVFSHRHGGKSRIIGVFFHRPEEFNGEQRFDCADHRQTAFSVVKIDPEKSSSNERSDGTVASTERLFDAGQSKTKIRLDVLRSSFQLTDTLRNLAENEANRPEFLSDDLIDQLAFILKYFTEKSHADLLKNVARIFR